MFKTLRPSVNNVADVKSGCISQYPEVDKTEVRLICNLAHQLGRVCIFIFERDCMEKKFRCDSVRLCRYLYSLGFDKESHFEEGKEYWLFDRTDELQISLGFYSYMRKQINKNIIWS